MKRLLLSILFCFGAAAADIIVGTGYNISFSAGTGGPWVDSMQSASGFKVGASAPTWGNFTDANIQVLRFSKSAANLVHGAVQLNHNYKEGGAIYPHVHVWFPIAAVATASTNVWKLDYSWASIGSAFPASAALYVTNSGAVTQYEHRIISFPTITGTAKTMSSIIAVTVTRVGTDDYDVYDDDIAMLGFDVHYATDTLGSRTESAK